MWGLDPGTGVLERLFDPWKSLQDRRSSSECNPSSLGLGLYIAERIVHAHGGQIDLESSKEHGTTFTVHLPRKP
ncbi:MAG: HAMP domain-containing sensor histidine kinase [Gemmatimonadota bacterium]